MVNLPSFPEVFKLESKLGAWYQPNSHPGSCRLLWEHRGASCGWCLQSASAAFQWTVERCCESGPCYCKGVAVWGMLCPWDTWNSLALSGTCETEVSAVERTRALLSKGTGFKGVEICWNRNLNNNAVLWEANFFPKIQGGRKWHFFPPPFSF